MFNPSDAIGLSEADAVAKIKAAGLRARVKRRDNQHLIGTMDYRTDRVNLEIDNGLVTKAYIG